MRIVSYVILALVGLGAFSELTLRYFVGLGDPPLSLRDPQIEYLFAPSKCYNRFGNTVCFNQWSMRSDDFGSSKATAEEKRILVLGDSVVNGGALTDQERLATTMLQRDLSSAIHNPVRVGNISAGSWGPANMLAYTRKFGWFEADLAFLVVSSHDLHDVPTFAIELGPDTPEKAPLLALQEFFVRYGGRYLSFLRAGPPSTNTPVGTDPDNRGPEALQALLNEAKTHVPHVFLLLHPTQPELVNGYDEHGRQIEQISERSGVMPLPMTRVLSSFGARAYRDDIHLNDLGQQAYYTAMSCISLQVLEDKPCDLIDNATERAPTRHFRPAGNP